MQEILPKQIVCTWCEKPADLSGHRKSQHVKTGRAYCGIECSKAYRAKISSETMTKTNKKYASKRMKKNNPMMKPESRAKMISTLKKMNHKPKIQGGNGKPPTQAEIYLNTMFSDLGFISQANIKTGHSIGDGSGYPPVYKPDLGHFGLKLAIEADGGSHLSLERKKQDKKKDLFLNGLGWVVLRFKNEEILKTPEVVAKTVMSTISKLMDCTLT